MKTHALAALAVVLCVLSCPSAARAVSTVDYVDVDTLIVIYTDYYSSESVNQHLDSTAIQHLEDETDIAREFLFRGSYLMCNMNYEWSEQADLLIIGDDQGERTLTPDMLWDLGDGATWLPPWSEDGGQTSVEDDLADAGIQNGSYSVVLVYYAFASGDGYSAWAGGATYGVELGYILGDAAYIAIPTCWGWGGYIGITEHEYEHALDSIYEASGNPGGNDFFNPDSMGTYTGFIDCGWDFRYKSLQDLDPASWLQLDSDWVTDQVAPDNDQDGVPDSGDLPITEQTLGTSAYSSDTDSDGLSDFEELQATYHDPSDPDNDSDTDDDGINDGNDAWPLYPNPPDIEQSDAVSVDGSIGSGEWIEVIHWNGSDSDINATYYARWDTGYLYVGFEVDDDQINTYFDDDGSEWWNDCVEIKIDARKDGWYRLTTDHNYRFRFVPKGSNGNCEVYAYDNYEDPPNDSWHPISTSTVLAKYTVSTNTYVVEARIPVNLIPGVTLGNGEEIRTAFAVQDFDGNEWEWWTYDPYSGHSWDDPGFVELPLTTPGGGGDVEIVGSWTSGTSHTAESGSDRLLVFTIHAEDSNSTPLNATSVTYGGQSMTKVIDESYYNSYEAYVAVFVLDDDGIDAASGSSFNVTWAQNPSATAAYSSVFLQNVNQSSPTGASDGNGGTSATLATSALSTDDGDLVIVAATCGNTGSYTVNNGFTEALEVSPSSADGVAGYKAATGVSETPSVTHSSVNRQVVVGFVVQASGGGGGDTTPPTFSGLSTATAGDGQVALSWSQASDPSTPITYNIYRATSSGGQNFGSPLDTTQDLSYTDTSVSNGTTYYYVVRAEDSESNEETNTVERSATPTRSGGGDVGIIGSWTSGSSHTAVAGSDRLLVFTIHCEDSNATALNPTSVTYGGQAMTKVVDRSYYSSYEAYVAVFVLKESGIQAASGSSFSVTWAQNPSATPAYSSVFLENVDQTTPTGATGNNGGTSATLATSALSTDDGDLVIVAATCGNTGSYTVNNGFTEALEVSPSSADGVAGSKAATGANETPSVTHSNVNRQVVVGLVVNHD